MDKRKPIEFIWTAYGEIECYAQIYPVPETSVWVLCYAKTERFPSGTAAPKVTITTHETACKAMLELRRIADGSPGLLDNPIEKQLTEVDE